MKRQCRNCRWWGWDHDAEEREPQYETCELTIRRNSEAAHPDSKAVADGADGYYVVLWTKPDFGCVQFEELLPVLADHFYFRHRAAREHRYSGVSWIDNSPCETCGLPPERHPRRPEQDHAYAEGTAVDPEYSTFHVEGWPPVLTCLVCSRPRWEHPGPTVAEVLDA